MLECCLETVSKEPEKQSKRDSSFFFSFLQIGSYCEDYCRLYLFHRRRIGFKIGQEIPLGRITQNFMATYRISISAAISTAPHGRQHSYFSRCSLRYVSYHLEIIIKSLRSEFLCHSRARACTMTRVFPAHLLLRQLTEWDWIGRC